MYVAYYINRVGGKMEKKQIAQTIKKIIKEEDLKNPYTDVEIAKLTNSSRSEVTLIRSQLEIEDSRKRRKPLLVKSIKEILDIGNDTTIRAITESMNKKGFRISRNAIAKILTDLKETGEFLNKEGIVENQEKDINDRADTMAFSNLIGSLGSLKPQVELAKAAILYPPDGLHTLIYGETGVGKSEIAECMYKFFNECKEINESRPFITFNCADYAENPQLLLSHLFGYKKGAFTGANEDVVGLVEKADGGILFLDEIHRLPPEGQEIFFFLIDKGKFRRLGETAVERNVKILLIAATTENIESNLLGTFRRRIPIIIELPSLKEKPFVERFEIIEKFFKQEALRMKAHITVSENVLKALILYEPSGNIGQIKSDIQVICARSFLKVMGRAEKTMKIDITELPNPVVKGLLKLNTYRDEIDKIIKSDLHIAGVGSESTEYSDDTSDVIPKKIYQVIEEKYKIMKYQGIEDKIINRVIENELEMKIYKSINHFRKTEKNSTKSDLKKIVGSKMLNIIDQMMFIAREHYHEIDESLYYSLATHLASTYDRLLNNKQISNSKLSQIKDQYPIEFDLARAMIDIASYELKISFPEDEIAFVAMYLKSYSRKDTQIQNHVGIIVVSHGQVASSMVSVANRLLGVQHARAVDMPFDQSPNITLNATMRIAKEIQNEKGILFLTDMGSLTSFGKLIGEELSIKTRMISRVDTLMVIEAIRKSIRPDAMLDEIADSLEIDDKKTLSLTVVDEEIKVIICLCLTGDGSAKMLKNTIIDQVELTEKIEIITMSALENFNISMTIRNMLQQKNIVAVVGTINPQVPLIPFINSSEIIKGTGIERLKNYLFDSSSEHDLRQDDRDDALYNLFDEKTTIIDSDIRSRNEAIEKMSNLLFELGYVTEEFKASVYEREDLNPTTFSGGLALPHGNPKCVIKPIIGILTLKKPILWDDQNHIDCIFFIAINDYYKNEFRKLYSIINNSYFRDKIKDCKSYRELLEVLKNV